MFKGKREMTFMSQVRCHTSMRGVSACLSPFVPSIDRYLTLGSASSVSNVLALGKTSDKQKNCAPHSTARNGKRGRLRIVQMKDISSF